MLLRDLLTFYLTGFTHNKVGRLKKANLFKKSTYDERNNNSNQSIAPRQLIATFSYKF